MTRITISLQEPEKEALIELAGKEYRDPRAQAAFIIRTELQRLGLLPAGSGNRHEEGTTAMEEINSIGDHHDTEEK